MKLLPNVKNEVEQIISSIPATKQRQYVEYWGSMTPTTHVGVFRRWLFAYASVHTTWQANVKLYELLKDLRWVGDTSKLEQLCIQSKAGLHKMRTRGIADFTEQFWMNPGWFYRGAKEEWTEYRDRVCKSLYGLGIAKVSFAIEMVYPVDCKVVCLDTHMFQLYGLNGNSHVKQSAYENMERHWNKACDNCSIEPALARHIFWDTKQKQPDTRYWLGTFERSDSCSIVLNRSNLDRIGANPAANEASRNNEGVGAPNTPDDTKEVSLIVEGSTTAMSHADGH